MDEKELQQLLDNTKAAAKKATEEQFKASKEAMLTEIEEATKGHLTLTQLEEKLEKMGLSDESVKEINNAIEKQGEEMRKLFESKNPNDEKSLEEQVKEKAEEIVKLATSEKNQVKMKIARKTQVTRASVANTTMAMRVPGLGELPYLGTVFTTLWRHARVSPSSNGVIRYYDQASATRNAANVAEGAQKPESAITWEERTLNLEKIADSIPVTKEAFNDVDFIASELDRLMNVNLALKVDQQLYGGTGVSPQLVGIQTSAPNYTPPGPGLGTVVDATLYDLIALLKVEISNSKQSKYMPNAVVMNPSDILKYKLAKGTDGHYVLPPFISADGNTIDGIRVVETSQVTANSMIVGDFRYGTIYDLEDVEITMGWINDQFIKNAMTILAEQRLGLLVRNVDVDAYLEVTDIDAAVTAITAP